MRYIRYALNFICFRIFAHLIANITYIRFHMI